MMDTETLELMAKVWDVMMSEFVDLDTAIEIVKAEKEFESWLN